MKLELSQTTFLLGLLALLMRHVWADESKYGNDDRNHVRNVGSESHDRVLVDMDNISELFQIDFSALNETLSSDMHLEIGVDELSAERVSEIWEKMAADAFKRCYDKEQNVTFSDRLEALCPYLVCISNAKNISEYDPFNSGFGRKNFLINIMKNAPGKWGSGLEESDLETVYNTDDESCLGLSVYASAVVFLNEAAKNDDNANALIIPLSRSLKIQIGVVQDILRAALGNIEDDDSRRKLEFVNGTTKNNTDPVPEVVQANHTLHTNHTLQVTLCQSLTSSKLDTVISSIKNLMSDKSPDGSQSLIKYLFGVEESQWDEIQDDTKFPERARFWKQVFDVGIDSDEACSALVGNLTFTGVFGSASKTKTLIIGFNEDANEDYVTVPCVLSLLMAVALTPQICSVSLTPQIDTLEQEVQPTNGKRNLNVYAGSKTQDSQTNRAVFWEVGLTGKGQVVAVSDSGKYQRFMNFYLIGNQNLYAICSFSRRHN